MISYVYALSSTAKGKAESQRLVQEINDSDIVPLLRDIRIGGGNIELWFGEEGLTANEQSILDGIVADHRPFSKTEDKPVYLPNIFAEDVELYFPGEGDTGGNVGGGQAFQMSSEVAGDTSITWQFRDWVYLAGGVLTYEGAEIGDTITFTVDAPASTVSSNPGSGNVNLVDVGGFNAIVPANNGSHDLVSPVPVPTDVGGAKYWEWSRPDTGSGTVTAKTNGKGSYSLFDVPLPLVTWLREMPLLGSNILDYKLPAVRPKRVLPHWTFSAKLTNSGHAGLKIVWVLFAARKVTQ